MIYLLMTDEGKRKKFAEGYLLDRIPSRPIVCSVKHSSDSEMTCFDSGVPCVVVLSNDNYPDYLASWPNLFSERMKQMMETEGIEGVALEKATTLSLRDLTPAQLKSLRNDDVKVNRIPNDPPAYYKPVATIYAHYHPITGIKTLESCSLCGYERIGPENYKPDSITALNLESLPQTDLFGAIGYTGCIFCTERFKLLCETYGMKGIEFLEVQILSQEVTSLEPSGDEEKEIHLHGLDVESLSALADDVLEKTIIDYILTDVVGSDDAHMYDRIKTLSLPFQHVFATWSLEVEIENGGFNQYFFNSTGEFAEEAHDGYTSFGSKGMPGIINGAISTLFDESELYKKTKKAGTMEAFMDSYKETQLGKWDDAYEDLDEDLFELRIAYIRNHLHEFVVK